MSNNGEYKKHQCIFCEQLAQKQKEHNHVFKKYTHLFYENERITKELTDLGSDLKHANKIMEKQKVIIHDLEYPKDKDICAVFSEKKKEKFYSIRDRFVETNPINNISPNIYTVVGSKNGNPAGTCMLINVKSGWAYTGESFGVDDPQEISESLMRKMMDGHPEWFKQI